MIKHISFDLWLTLIKSHPLFKKKRAEYIHSRFNPKGLTVEQIDSLIRKLDKVFDWHNEHTGQKLAARTMYNTILQFTHNDFNVEMGEEITQYSDQLFLEYLPELLNDNIIPMLSNLRERGYTLNLSSNTGFIEGHTLQKALEQLNMLHYFSFCIYSDQVGASKPSASFFQEVYKKVNVAKDEVLHIGDNPITDYKGALAFGFRALLINNNYSLNDIEPEL